MIRRKEDARLQERPNVRGGDGVIHNYHLLEPEETMGKCRLVAMMVIDPGCSLGEHPHGPDAEIYYVVEGELTGTDNGKPIILRTGDTMFTGGGETHSVRNETDTPVRLLAIVIE